MPHAATASALPRDALARVASPLRDALAAAPYEPPAGSSASVKSLLASLLPSPSPSPSQTPAGKEAADLLLFCAAAGAASTESPALHWVPRGLSGVAAAAVEEMAAAGGWDGVGEMVLAMMPEVVPPLKTVVKQTCIDSDNDEIGALKPPKEHAVVAAHQFRWLVSQWMHVDDDKTVLLVLEQIHAIIKLTWIRKSPYTSRLVDELVLLYKESATRRSREVMRNHILEMLVLLQKCKGLQFEEAWKKHELDPDLIMLLFNFNQLCTKDNSPEC